MADTFGGAVSVRTVLIGLAGAAGLFLAWQAADALLLIFGGLLFAALLDACTRGLSAVVTIGRGWALATASVLIAIVILGLFVWSGFSFASQIGELVASLTRELQALENQIAALGVTPSEQSQNHGAGELGRLLLPNLRQLFGEAGGAFVATLGIVGNAVVVALIGLFVAVNPSAYRRGVIEMLPLHNRHRIGHILDEIAHALRRWLIGQLIAMVLLAFLTWIMLVALGIPSPVLLALQAGLFNFIPYLGAVVGAAPILLMALPLGLSTTLIALSVFTVIHAGMGYLLMPIIQKRAVDLPPALTLASLLIFAVLFGVASVAVATPLVAAIRMAILMWREEDVSLQSAAG